MTGRAYTLREEARAVRHLDPRRALAQGPPPATSAPAAALAAAGEAADRLAALISGIVGASPRMHQPAGLAAAAGLPPAAQERQQQQQQQLEQREEEQEMPRLPAGPPHALPSSSRAAFPQPPDCAFLRPGQSFEGRQRVAHNPNKHEHWEVLATIQHYDPQRGYIAGTMEANNVPDAPAPVTTFFEGEIIDNLNHTFYTCDWDACADVDTQHWTKFEPFRRALHAEVVRHGGRCPSLASHPFIYMRWKEQFFVRGSECRLTIAGFYYLCISRANGSIQGWYFDPSSSPDQKLRLAAVRAGPAGFAFPHYDLA